MFVLVHEQPYEEEPSACYPIPLRAGEAAELPLEHQVEGKETDPEAEEHDECAFHYLSLPIAFSMSMPPHLHV